VVYSSNDENDNISVPQTDKVREPLDDGFLQDDIFCFTEEIKMYSPYFFLDFKMRISGVQGKKQYMPQKDWKLKAVFARINRR
jgi:hypothetical protein